MGFAAAGPEVCVVREGLFGVVRVREEGQHRVLCVCGKKASRGFAGHFGETGAVEWCRREVFKNEKCLRWCVRSGQVAVATHACAGNDASECQFHFSVKK